VEKLPLAPSGAALAGGAVHEVIEEMIREDNWWRDPFMVENEGARRAIVKFEKAVEEAGGADACRWGGRKRNLKDEAGKDVVDEQGNKIKVGEDYRWMIQTLPTWVKRAGTILRRDEQSGLYIVQANVERSVTAWLVPPEQDLPYCVAITGIIDLMLLADDLGQPRIRDWKTGTMLEKVQLAVYAWLLEQLPDSVRISTNQGEIAYLRGSKPEDWIKPYDLTGLKPVVPQLFLRMVQGLEAGVYHLNPSSFCGSCWVKEHCPVGRGMGEEAA
jgi:hypothetical protein